MHHPLPVAVWITDVDQMQFNNAVNKKHYPCAPKTERGSRREFDETDMIGLYVFGRLIEFMTSENAGQIACGVVAAVRAGRFRFLGVTKATAASANLAWEVYGVDEPPSRNDIQFSFNLEEIKAKIVEGARAWAAMESRE